MKLKPRYLDENDTIMDAITSCTLILYTPNCDFAISHLIYQESSNSLTLFDHMDFIQITSMQQVNWYATDLVLMHYTDM